MKRLWLISFTCFVLIGGVTPGWAQKGDIDLSKLDSTELAMLSQFYDMSLEELESLKASSGLSSELEKVINSLIEIAAQSRYFSTRSAPSVVTLITEEEIKNAGARDLIDVLRLVPGFHFALDLNGRVGLGIRGNWANEGKVLLMINGQEMNDIFSANLSFGNHYPVDMIERIEVIRGPGSAVYGGFAEYGVINIVTKEFAGIRVGATWGRYVDEGERARRNNQIYVGLEGRKNGIYFTYFGGQGQRSTAQQFGYYRYNDLRDTLRVGRFGSLLGNSAINPRMFSLHIKSGGFHFRNLTDLYEVTDVTTIDEFGNRPVRNMFVNNYTDLRWDIRMLKKRLTLTPRVNVVAQAPQVLGIENTGIQLPLRTEFTIRGRASLTLDYDITHRIKFTAGAETFGDAAFFDFDDGLVNFSDDSLVLGNGAIFGQLVLRLPFINITGGLRYDQNQAYGYAYSPRIGLTKQLGRFHFKLLGSWAFRAPSIGNVALAFDGTYIINEDSTRVLLAENQEIDPERTLYLEAEAGFQLTRDMILTANAYNFFSKDPIVFHFYQDETIRNVFGNNAGFFAYQNFPKSGTWGVELDYRFKKRWGYLNANYSFYSAQGKSNPQPYQVRTYNRDPEMRQLVNSDQLLAFPQHKINVNTCFYLGSKQNLSFNLNGTWYSRRYTYDIEVTGSNEVSGILTSRDPTLLVNAYLRHDNFILRGLDVGIGVYDILNNGYDYLQPYFGLNVPLPGPSRELVMKASLDINFRSKQKRQEEEIRRNKERFKQEEKDSDTFSSPRNSKS